MNAKRILETWADGIVLISALILSWFLIGSSHRKARSQGGEATEARLRGTTAPPLPKYSWLGTGEPSFAPFVKTAASARLAFPFDLQLAATWMTSPVQSKPIFFEIASIRPSYNNEPYDQQLLPNGFLLKGGTVSQLINLAYEPAELIPLGSPGSGPAWVHHDEIDLLAKVPPEKVMDWQRQTTSGFRSPVFQDAIQELLVERYKLEAHTKALDAEGFALVLAHSVPKTELVPAGKSSMEDSVASPTSSGNGLTVLPGGVVHFHDLPLSKLADFISSLCSFPVEDRTGLIGRYNFSIHDMQPVHTTTLEKEDYRLPTERWDLKPLGLKLVRAKVNKSVVIIDHIQNPPSN